MEVEYYDHSMLNGFWGCNRFYFERYENDLVRERDEPRYPLEFGVGVHSALEFYYNCRKDGITCDDEDVVRVFIESFKNEQPSPILKSGKTGEAIYTRVRGSFLLLEYLERWRDVNDNRKVINVEIGFAEMLTDDIAYCGRIDRMEEETGGVRDVDIKTSSRMDRLTLNPNNQLMGYQWGGSKYFENVAGVALDVIGVYKSKPLSDCFDRQYEKYGKYQMQGWKDGVVETVRRIRRCRETGVWPMTTSHCGAYAGRCGYMALCTCTSRECEEQLRETMFVKDEWKPYKENQSENNGS